MTERIVTWTVLILCLFALTGAVCNVMVEATPCAVEDDTWCHWDATQHGNGQGRSFTTYWEGFTVINN